MSIAHELITRGWTQEARENNAGEVCIAGAVSYATLGHAYGNCLESKEFSAAWIELNKVVEWPMTWNDRPGRTFDEVLRAAKEADALLDGLACP